MGNDESMAEAMAQMFQSILATPKQQRRLKSGTFWERLGCRRRTPGLIEQVRALFQYHRVSLSVRHRHTMAELADIPLGSEHKEDWIILTYQRMQSVTPEGVPQLEAVPSPTDPWFEEIVRRNCESESDVVHFFIRPLFVSLGYEELDMATEYPTDMHQGRIRAKDAEADFVVFGDENHVRENSLILAEAKKRTKPIDADVAGQARSYAMWLSPVYYVLTNADEIEIWLYQMTVADDVRVMSFKRADLKQKWPELFKLLCKKRVLEVKEKRRQILLSLQSLV